MTLFPGAFMWNFAINSTINIYETCKIEPLGILFSFACQQSLHGTWSFAKKTSDESKKVHRLSYNS